MSARGLTLATLGLTCLLLTQAFAQSAGSASEQEKALKEQIATLQSQLAALQAQSAGKPAKPTAAKPAVAKPGMGDFSRFATQFNREHGYSEEAKPAVQPPTPDACKPQQVYLRSDSIDNYLYGVTPASKAKGAAISWLNDYEGHAQTLSIDGMASFLMFSDLCPKTPQDRGTFASGWAIAPFVEAHGKLLSPRTAKEQSSLKSGVQFQAEVSSIGGFPARQVFTLAPYHQTDFRGLGRIEGLSARWDLYDADRHLGGYIPEPGSPLGWFVQLQGEADLRRVEDVGVTALTKANYAWLGGTSRLSLFLFPGGTGPEWLQGRASFLQSVSWFHDADGHHPNISQSVSTLKYALTPEGSSSLALEYTSGTAKDTLEKSRQILLKLLYAY